MIVACAALLTALGGVSYAAAVLPKNSVGTAQLQKQAVSGGKLKTSAVTTAKVKNGSLLAADFKASQVPAGPQGPKGDPGPQGPKGDPGPQGEQGISGTVRAYAHVENDGPALIAARTKNFASVSHVGGTNSGRYCLTPGAGIDPNTHPAVVSPDHYHSSGGDLAAYVSHPSFYCAAGQFEVFTQQAGANSDDVAFTVIVP
jgi:hypothetical protein